MLDWFDFQGHVCIAFEMLGISVFDFLVSDTSASADQLLHLHPMLLLPKAASVYTN